MNDSKVDRRLLMPVLAGFFIMGFCDMVAPVTSRIAAEFPPESRRFVDFLPTMVFLWFLLLSIPVAAWMNRWGRKRTALLGYAFTFVGLALPFVAGEGCSLGIYFAGFGLLGVGNTIVQVAVNPLLATIVPSARMTGYLTVGQIFRNVSLLLVAPLVTLFAAWTGSWRGLLLLYALLTVVGGIWLQAVAVPEPDVRTDAVRFADCFRLLRNRTVLLCTGGVACFIAADIGINFVAVRLIDSPMSMLTSTGFYACRIVGTLVGAWLLIRYSDVKYLLLNMGVALGLCIALLFVHDRIAHLCDYGSARICDGMRLRHVLCRGHQGRGRPCQRRGRTDDHGHLRRSPLGTGVRCPHPCSSATRTWVCCSSSHAWATCCGRRSD